MKPLLYGIGLLVAIVIATMPVLAEEVAKPVISVESLYMGLSGGPLRQAKLVTLPKGTLLRAGTVTITEKDLTDELAKAKPGLQDQLKKHQFFLLEELAIEALLCVEARAWATQEKREVKESDEAVIRAYLQSVAGKATVTDDELQAFHAANKDLLGGAAYEAVEMNLRSYLLGRKQQEAVDGHIQRISERVPIEVDATWVSTQAAQSLDNPVDKARRAGKPALVDFGASGCGPCDMMEPILKDLKQSHADQCTVLYVDVREEQVLAARYGVQGIPVQVFFDKDGKEVFRHVGFFPKDSILEKLAELGVK